MAAAVQQNELVFEFASSVMEDEQQLGDSSVFPAVIVEHVPNVDLLQNYSGLTCVQEPHGMITEGSIDVAEEQIIEDDDDDYDEDEDEITIPVEVSCHNGEETMETIEAAEALLNMDSPGPILDDRRISHVFMPAVGDMICTPVTHVSVTEDGIPEVEEVHQFHNALLSEEKYVALVEDQTSEQPKKRKGRRSKPPRPDSPSSTPNFSFKKKSKDGKGNTIYLWEFLLALLQDETTCPRYIKWTQREKGIFKLVDSKAVSRLWGKHKNKPDMNYETMGRALRYYYQRGILSKVEGQRLVYQFKEMPNNLIVIDERDPSSSVESQECISEKRTSMSPTCLPSVPSRCQTDQSVGTLHSIAGSRGISVVEHSVIRTKPAENTRESKLGRTTEMAQHTTVLLEEEARTEQVVPTHLYRSIHIMQPATEETSDGQAVVTSTVQGAAVTALTSPAQGIGTIQNPAQVPVVVSAGSQQVRTLTFQTVPFSAVITNSDSSAPTTVPAKFILQTIPVSQPVTVLKENIILHSPKTVSPTSSVVFSSSQTHQVLAGNLQTVAGSVVSMSPTTTFGTATPVVTFASSGQKLLTQPPATVITSVIKTPEVRQTVSRASLKLEIPEDYGRDSSEHYEQKYPQPSVVVLGNPAAFISDSEVKTEEKIVYSHYE